MDRAPISNLAGGPQPVISWHLVSRPEAQELHEAKKRLIATLPELEIRLTHWKQKDFTISNRNKNPHLAFCSSDSTLTASQPSDA
jgi:hypothetical protein